MSEQREFVFFCKGKDGNTHDVRVPCESFEAAQHVIDQLGLVVGEFDYGPHEQSISVGDDELNAITDSVDHKHRGETLQ